MSMDTENEHQKNPSRKRFSLPLPKCNSSDDFSIAPFRPVLICAIVFWAVFRLVNFYFAYTATFDWYVWIWQSSTKGVITMMDSMKWVSCGFLVVSFLELLLYSKEVGRRISFAFCLLMAIYVFTMDLFMDELKIVFLGQAF